MIAMSSPAVTPPRVFISYRLDPQDNERVLALADKLVREGVDAVLDRYAIAPPEGWTRWIDEGLKRSDFVLVICTEGYQKSAGGTDERGLGRGVNREGLIIDQTIYENHGRNERFIPVLLRQSDAAFVPTFLRPYQVESVETEEGYVRLYRRLFNQPEIVKPALGPPRPLLPRPVDPGGDARPLSPALNVSFNHRWAALYDRRPQAMELEKLIVQRADRGRRPLAFVVSGPDSERHDALHQRLSQIPLPQWLVELNDNRNEIRPLDLDAPPDDESVAAAILMKRIETNLGAGGVGNGKTIVDRLPPGLTYFQFLVDLRHRSTRLHAKTLVQILLRLLNDRERFPDLPPGKAVCAGISISWKDTGPSQKKLAKDIPEEKFPNLRFRVLPDLAPPQPDDARHWTDVIANLKPGALSPAARYALEKFARGLFGANQSLPMEKLYDEFMNLPM
jgi:hypothetical protein